MDELSSSSASAAPINWIPSSARSSIPDLEDELLCTIFSFLIGPNPKTVITLLSTCRSFRNACFSSHFVAQLANSRRFLDFSPLHPTQFSNFSISFIPLADKSKLQLSNSLDFYLERCMNSYLFAQLCLKLVNGKMKPSDWRTSLLTDFSDDAMTGIFADRHLLTWDLFFAAAARVFPRRIEPEQEEEDDDDDEDDQNEDGEDDALQENGEAAAVVENAPQAPLPPVDQPQQQQPLQQSQSWLQTAASLVSRFYYPAAETPASSSAPASPSAPAPADALANPLQVDESSVSSLSNQLASSSINNNDNNSSASEQVEEILDVPLQPQQNHGADAEDEVLFAEEEEPFKVPFHDEINRRIWHRCVLPSIVTALREPNISLPLLSKLLPGMDGAWERNFTCPPLIAAELIPLLLSKMCLKRLDLVTARENAYRLPGEEVTQIRRYCTAAIMHLSATCGDVVREMVRPLLQKIGQKGLEVYEEVSHEQAKQEQEEDHEVEVEEPNEQHYEQPEEQEEGEENQDDSIGDDERKGRENRENKKEKAKEEKRIYSIWKGKKFVTSHSTTACSNSGAEDLAVISIRKPKFVVSKVLEKTIVAKSQEEKEVEEQQEQAKQEAEEVTQFTVVTSPVDGPQSDLTPENEIRVLLCTDIGRRGFLEFPLIVMGAVAPAFSNDESYHAIWREDIFPKLLDIMKLRESQTSGLEPLFVSLYVTWGFALSDHLPIMEEDQLIPAFESIMGMLQRLLPDHQEQGQQQQQQQQSQSQLDFIDFDLQSIRNAASPPIASEREFLANAYLGELCQFLEDDMNLLPDNFEAVSDILRRALREFPNRHTFDAIMSICDLVRESQGEIDPYPFEHNVFEPLVQYLRESRFDFASVLSSPLPSSSSSSSLQQAEEEEQQSDHRLPLSLPLRAMATDALASLMELMDPSSITDEHVLGLLGDCMTSLRGLHRTLKRLDPPMEEMSEERFRLHFELEKRDRGLELTVLSVGEMMSAIFRYRKFADIFRFHFKAFPSELQELVQLLRPLLSFPRVEGRKVAFVSLAEVVDNFGILHPAIMPNALHMVQRCVDDLQQVFDNMAHWMAECNGAVQEVPSEIWHRVIESGIGSAYCLGMLGRMANEGNLGKPVTDFVAPDLMRRILGIVKIGTMDYYPPPFQHFDDLVSQLIGVVANLFMKPLSIRSILALQHKSILRSSSTSFRSPPAHSPFFLELIQSIETKERAAALLSTLPGSLRSIEAHQDIIELLYVGCSLIKAAPHLFVGQDCLAWCDDMVRVTTRWPMDVLIDIENVSADPEDFIPVLQRFFAQEIRGTILALQKAFKDLPEDTKIEQENCQSLISMLGQLR